MSEDTSATFVNPEYGSSELLTMYEFYKNGTLCDMAVIVENERLNTHKLLLAICCKYFRDKFIDNPETVDIELSQVDKETFNKILKYFYEGNIELTLDSIQRLLLAAKLLELNVLFDVCSQFFLNHMTFETLFKAKTFAEENSLNDLTEKLDIYHKENLAEFQLLENEKFLQLSLEDVVTTLQTKNINLPSEKLFEKIDKWIVVEEVERKQHLPTLLESINLTSMKFPFFNEKVVPYCDGVQECQALLVKTYRLFSSLVQDRLYINPIDEHINEKTYKVMVIGGENEPISSYIDFYDPIANTWLETKVTDLKITDFGAVKLENHMIVVGGKKARKALNEVVVVNLETLKIENLSPLQTNRKNLCIAQVYDDDSKIILYAIGGHDDNQYLNTVEKWHPLTHIWSEVSPMVAYRGSFSVAAIGNNIYAIGGQDDDGILNTVEVYSTRDDTWSSCEPMNHSRYCAGVAAVGNFIYAIGGSDDDGPVLSVERYNVESNTWTILDETNFPEDLKYASACNLEDNIIVIGGRQVQRYFPENNTWKELPSLGSTRNRALVLAMLKANKATESEIFSPDMSMPKEAIDFEATEEKIVFPDD